MNKNNSENKNESASNSSPLPIPKITNFVSVAELGTNLDLEKISMKVPNCIAKNKKSEPNEIWFVKMSIKEPNATVMIFKTGKIKCFGAKSEEESKQAINIAVKKIKKIGYGVYLKNFSIVNITAICEVNFEIKLTKLAITLSDTNSKSNSKDFKKGKCSFDCEIFPGLIYHMKNPEITLLIFSVGKINILGAKNRSDIFDALNKIYPLLLKHKNN